MRALGIALGVGFVIMASAASAAQLEGAMAKGRLFERGETRVYRKEHLGAISFPLGGIGAGCIQMDGKARLAAWQIFNNYNNASVPDSFFAVRAKPAGGRAVVRALQTQAVGPFEAMKSLSFRGEYPLAWYDFEDRALPVRVSLEAFSPFTPMNAKDSAMPCIVFNVTAENTSGADVEVSLLAAQQNAVGFTGAEEIKGRKAACYGGNSNRIVLVNGGALLHMTADMARDAAGYGDMALVALGGDVTGAASCDMDALKERLLSARTLAGPETAKSGEGETLDGALASSFELAPGEKKTVTFILAWHFPNVVQGTGAWGGKGNMYASWWPSALHVAQDASRRLEGLTRLTRLYHDTFYASNLPHWLLDRVSSQVGVLRSRTCFWTRDGYLGGWEGCCPTKGCCAGNCSHVWHYAQAHARLFPEIGRLLRDQELSHEREDGGVPHRQFPGTEPATDGQLGTILESYREYLCSVDGKWLHERWPRIQKAMDYVIRSWDADEDGVLAGRQWNTLDDALGGSTSWMGSLYLAALAAAEKMALIENDAALAARYRRIRESGSTKQDATLFNGDYYFQIPDPEPRKDYLTGCHIDQVLGQWWAGQLDLGWVYPPEHVRIALKSLLKYNFKPDFHGKTQVPRKFVADDDAGTQMITWPKGGRPDPEHCIYYGDEVMTGFEYSAAAAMVQAGLIDEGFTIVRAIYDRYDGKLRADLTPGENASWGYSGNPFGDDECGKFYARAMSVWSMLTACQGFIYDGPAGLIGFKPVWKPEDHASFFTAAEGYGLFTQRRTKTSQTESIKVAYGKLEVKSMVFELAAGLTPAKVTVKLAGNDVPCESAVNDVLLRIELASPITMIEGQELDVGVL